MNTRTCAEQSRSTIAPEPKHGALGSTVFRKWNTLHINPAALPGAAVSGASGCGFRLRTTICQRGSPASLRWLAGTEPILQFSKTEHGTSRNFGLRNHPMKFVGALHMRLMGDSSCRRQRGVLPVSSMYLLAPGRGSLPGMNQRVLFADELMYLGMHFPVG